MVARDQHLAPGRPRRQQADRPPDQGPPRPRAGRQRLDPRLDTERPDTWEVQGRGELQLVVLLEMMRREGYELTAGQPQVVTREDRRQEARAGRAARDRHPRGAGRRRHPGARRPQGRMEQMVNDSTGWVRMEFLVPARGLIGFRTEFLTRRAATASSTTSSTAGSPGRRLRTGNRLARGRPPRPTASSRSSASRSAACPSSAPARRSTRG